MDAGGLVVAVAAVGTSAGCWLLCGPSGAGPAAPAAAPGSDLERLRQDVARAEQALHSEARGGVAAPHGVVPTEKAYPASTGPTPAWLSRTTLLLGEESMGKLADARVLVVGLGGVGGYTAEFLVRGGVGHITVVDGDTVDPTNRNRQLIALASTEGQEKSAALAQRLRDINPDVDVTALQQFVPADPAAVDALVASQPFDFVVDAIDSLQPKVELIRAALKHRVRVVSSMGAGGRVDPSKVIVTDLSLMQWDREAIRTAKRAGNRANAGPIPHEKLGAAVRKMLEKQYGIVGGVTIVTSEEIPKMGAFALTPDKTKHKASFYGTCSFIPAAFGLHAAAVVLNALGPADGGAKKNVQTKKERALRKAAEQAAAKH